MIAVGSIIYPGRTDSTNYLLAATAGAPPPSAAGGPVFPGGAGGSGGPGGGSGGVAQANSCGTPGSGGSGPNGIAGTNGQEFDCNNVRLSSKSDVLSVLRTIQMPNSGLEIKDRMWLKITIPNAFLGIIKTYHFATPITPMPLINVKVQYNVES